MNLQAKKDVYQQYAAKLSRRRLALLPVLFLFLACVGFTFSKAMMLLIAPHHTLVKAGVSLVVASFGLFSWADWRCPACNHFLGKAWNPKFCSDCGTQLHD